jgi:hypothetical protein
LIKKTWANTKKSNVLTLANLITYWDVCWLVRFLILIVNCMGYSGGLTKSDNLQVKGNASLSSE